MKKKFTLALALLLVLGLLAGCSDPGPVSAVSGMSSGSSPSPAPAEACKIGVVQFADNDTLNTVREAFLGRLEEWGYDEEKVTLDYQNAQGETAKAESICKKFVEDKVDMIVALSTPAAKAAVEAAKATDIQVVFAGVSDPKASLGLANLEQPEGNVTGTCNKVPVSAIVDLALQIDSGLHSLGLLYLAEDSDSADAAKEAKAYGESKGLEVTESAVADQKELQKAAEELCAKTDGIFTAGGTAASAQVKTVAQAALAAKTPWYVSTDAMVQGGALGGITIDYAQMGRQTADMAVELMVGKKVSQVPVVSFTQGAVYFNQSTSDALGITLPEEVSKSANIISAQEPAASKAAE